MPDKSLAEIEIRKILEKGIMVHSGSHNVFFSLDGTVADLEALINSLIAAEREKWQNKMVILDYSKIKDSKVRPLTPLQVNPKSHNSASLEGK